MCFGFFWKKNVNVSRGGAFFNVLLFVLFNIINYYKNLLTNFLILSGDVSIDSGFSLIILIYMDLELGQTSKNIPKILAKFISNMSQEKNLSTVTFTEISQSGNL